MTDERSGAKRTAVPQAIQEQVLISSRRRCCVCAFLNGDHRERKGQIAHLDGDSSNSTLDNLVWLCLEHHDELDSRTSQRKGLSSHEVRRHRDTLYASPQRPFTVQAAPTGESVAIDVRVEADFDTWSPAQQESLLKAFGLLLNTPGTVRIVRISRGSVIVRLEVPQLEADRLVELCSKGYLRAYGVTAAQLTDKRTASTAVDVTPSNTSQDVGIISDVRVKLIIPRRDNLLAFAAVTFRHILVIRDFKVIEGTRGPFVSMPSRKLRDRCPACGTANHLTARYCNDCGSRLQDNRAAPDERGRPRIYADIAHALNAEGRDYVASIILSAFWTELERSKTTGYVPTNFDDLDYDDLAL